MSNEFGYIPESPEQSFGNNKGIFTPTDIYDLTRADKYTNYGQLELIETQTASADSSLDFTDLGSYNVHFLTASLTESTASPNFRVSNNGGSSFLSSGYQLAGQFGGVGGTFGEDRTTNTSIIADFGSGGTGLSKNGYVYFYNLLDSTKYSFSSWHSFSDHSTLTNSFFFGSGVKPTAETHNALQIRTSGNFTGVVSLYGIRYS